MERKEYVQKNKINKFLVDNVSNCLKYFTVLNKYMETKQYIYEEVNQLVSIFTYLHITFKADSPNHNSA